MANGGAMAYYDDVEAASLAVAQLRDADVVIFNGGMDVDRENILIARCNEGERAPNLVLVLCTSGGSPDAAYRLGRYFQSHYSKFTVLVSGHCKSAGTLLTIAAHNVVMGERAELGPLDIQLGKKDTFFEDGSGLEIANAISEIEERAYEIFENTFVKLIMRTKQRVTLKTATSLAKDFAVGVVAPLVSQVDPVIVSEASRAMRVGKEYGERLSGASLNLRAGALHKLVSGYPSHSFVIDRKEAEDLFINVREPDAAEAMLLDILGDNTRIPKGSQDDPIVIIFKQGSNAPVPDHHAQDAGTGQGAAEAAGNGLPAGDPGEGHAVPANDAPDAAAQQA